MEIHQYDKKIEVGEIDYCTLESDFGYSAISFLLSQTQNDNNSIV